MTNLNSLFADECLQNRTDQERVFVISHSTSIVHNGSEIIEYFVRNFVILLYEKDELFAADPQVLIRKCIRNVPTDWSELSPILHNGMEETETE